MKNKSLAKKNRDYAIKRVEENNASWIEDCMKIFRRWLLPLRGRFQSEDFRAYAMAYLDKPTSLRVFGAVMVRAKNLGWIRKAGPPQPVDSENCNMAYSNVWRKAKVK